MIYAYHGQTLWNIFLFFRLHHAAGRTGHSVWMMAVQPEVWGAGEGGQLHSACTYRGLHLSPQLAAMNPAPQPTSCQMLASQLAAAGAALCATLLQSCEQLVPASRGRLSCGIGAQGESWVMQLMALSRNGGNGSETPVRPVLELSGTSRTPAGGRTAMPVDKKVFERMGSVNCQGCLGDATRDRVLSTSFWQRLIEVGNQALGGGTPQLEVAALQSGPTVRPRNEPQPPWKERVTGTKRVAR